MKESIQIELKELNTITSPQQQHSKSREPYQQLEDRINGNNKTEVTKDKRKKKRDQSSNKARRTLALQMVILGWFPGTKYDHSNPTEKYP